MGLAPTGGADRGETATARADVGPTEPLPHPVWKGDSI